MKDGGQRSQWQEGDTQPQGPIRSSTLITFIQWKDNAGSKHTLTQVNNFNCKNGNVIKVSTILPTSLFHALQNERTTTLRANLTAT